MKIELIIEGASSHKMDYDSFRCEMSLPVIINNYYFPVATNAQEFSFV